MKTAMQELIEELKRVQLMTNMNFVIRIASDLLEKEKEQIIESYYEGHTAPYFSPNGNDVEKQAEEYYNQTYNQNK